MLSNSHLEQREVDMIGVRWTTCSSKSTFLAVVPGVKKLRLA